MWELSELKQMVFIDIETTTGKSSYQEVIGDNPALDQYWQLKHKQLKASEPEGLADVESAVQMYERMAALHPEWGKIVCISIGQLKFNESGEPVDFACRSYYSDDEKQLLSEFNDAAAKIINRYPSIKWVGHNVRGFDMPYIVKRSIVNGVKVPRAFHFHSLKPWESPLIDTQEVWRFGGWNTAKLGLIAEILGIPSPKQDLEGSMVSQVYWQGGNLERIKDYCEADIKATANVILKMSGIDILS